MHMTFNRYVYMFKGVPLALKSIDNGGRRYLAPDYEGRYMPFMIENGYISDNLVFQIPISQLPEDYKTFYTYGKKRDTETFFTDSKDDMHFIREYIKVLPVFVTVEDNDEPDA